MDGGKVKTRNERKRDSCKQQPTPSKKDQVEYLQTTEEFSIALGLFRHMTRLVSNQTVFELEGRMLDLS